MAAATIVTTITTTTNIAVTINHAKYDRLSNDVAIGWRWVIKGSYLASKL